MNQFDGEPLLPSYPCSRSFLCYFFRTHSFLNSSLDAFLSLISCFMPFLHSVVGTSFRNRIFRDVLEGLVEQCLEPEFRDGIFPAQGRDALLLWENIPGENLLGPREGGEREPFCDELPRFLLLLSYTSI